MQSFGGFPGAIEENPFGGPYQPDPTWKNFFSTIYRALILILTDIRDGLMACWNRFDDKEKSDVADKEKSDVADKEKSDVADKPAFPRLIEDMEDFAKTLMQGMLALIPTVLTHKGPLDIQEKFHQALMRCIVAITALTLFPILLYFSYQTFFTIPSEMVKKELQRRFMASWYKTGIIVLELWTCHHVISAFTQQGEICSAICPAPGPAPGPVPH